VLPALVVVVSLVAIGRLVGWYRGRW
jgi:hypothetical protein